MRIGVVGINHKLASVNLRDLLAKACQRRFGKIQHLNHHFILLSTCNRTEIYFSSEDPTLTHSYILKILRHEVGEELDDQKLYSYFGIDCFLHLSRVTAGLDSAIIAETEIQKQVKDAYQRTLFHPLPKDLHYLFQKSLKNGKLVRSRLPLMRGIPNIEHALWHIGQQNLLDPFKAKILFVGASEINQRILHYFKSKGLKNITLCNRTLSRAEKVANHTGVSLLPWENFSTMSSYDWIIFGTKAEGPLLTKKELYGKPGRRLIIDLCIPRNVDPLLDFDPYCIVYNIDQIHHILGGRKEKISHLLTEAERLIIEAVKGQESLFMKREASQLAFYENPRRRPILVDASS